MAALSTPSFLLVSKELHRSSGRTTFRLALPTLRGPYGAEAPGGEVDSGCGASEVESCDIGACFFSAALLRRLILAPGTTSTASSTLVLSPTPANQPSRRSHLTINLLSRVSGRPHLAKVARELAIASHDGQIKSQGLSEGLITETIEGAPSFLDVFLDVIS